MAKKQIHPLIDEEDLDTLKLFGIRPSKAIKIFVNGLKNENTKIDNEIEVKNGIIDALKSERELLDKKIENLELEVISLEQNKNKVISDSLSNYKDATEIIEKRFTEIENALNKKWGVKKMTIKELESISLEYSIAPEILLKDHPRRRLEKVLENYRKYS